MTSKLLLDVGPNHLSPIPKGEDVGNLQNSLPDVNLFSVQIINDHFIEFFQMISTRVAPSDMIVTQKKQLVVKATDYQLIIGKLYKLGVHGIL
jgi:hypothetical protein